MKLYNFKCWNWTETGTKNKYMKAAVFAVSPAKARQTVREWLAYDEYFLFESYPPEAL